MGLCYGNRSKLIQILSLQIMPSTEADWVLQLTFPREITNGAWSLWGGFLLKALQRETRPPWPGSAYHCPPPEQTLGLSSQDSASCNMGPHRSFPRATLTTPCPSGCYTHLPILMPLGATPELASRFLHLGCMWLTSNLINASPSPVPWAGPS